MAFTIEKFRGMYITHVGPDGAVHCHISDPDGARQDFTGSWKEVLGVARREYDDFTVVGFEHGVMGVVDLDMFRNVGMNVTLVPQYGRAIATRRVRSAPNPESSGFEPGLGLGYDTELFSPTGYC